MKKLFLLIVLGVGAWAGYRYWYLPGLEQQVVEGPTDGVDQGGTADAISAAMGLPEALVTMRQEADAAWDAVVQAGKDDPTLSDQAPQLARLYSAVLAGSYAHPGMQDLQQELIDERLKPLADRLFFSKTMYRNDPTGFFAAHTIKHGELLDSIGREYGLSYQHINIMRGADPEDSRYGEGSVVKVYHGNDPKFGGFLIHIDKSDFFMDVYLGGLFARRYPIGHGAVESPTPSGTTRLVARVRDPQWTNPTTGEVFEAGDPGNVLGGYWLPFDEGMLGVTGLGIHGFTGEGPATGALVSNGCIRMRNEDAAELYCIMVPTAGKPTSSSFKSRVPMKVVITD